MKWAHLPEQGGIYDQHPLLIDRFFEIMSAVAAQQEKENNKNRPDMGNKMPRPSMGGRPRRS